MKTNSLPTNYHLTEKRFSVRLIREDKDYNYAVKTASSIQKFTALKKASKVARAYKAQGEKLVMLYDVRGDTYYYWNEARGIFQSIL